MFCLLPQPSNLSFWSSYLQRLCAREVREENTWNWSLSLACYITVGRNERLKFDFQAGRIIVNSNGCLPNNHKFGFEISEEQCQGHWCCIRFADIGTDSWTCIMLTTNVDVFSENKKIVLHNPVSFHWDLTQRRLGSPQSDTQTPWQNRVFFFCFFFLMEPTAVLFGKLWKSLDPDLMHSCK